MKKFKNLMFLVTILTLINFSCKKDNASPPITGTTPLPVSGDTIPNLLLGKWNVILENDTITTNYGNWLLIQPVSTYLLDGSYSIFQNDGTFSEDVTYLDSLGVLQTFKTSLFFTVKGDELDMSTARNAPPGSRYFIVKLTSTDFIYYQTKIFSSTSLKEWLFLSR